MRKLTIIFIVLTYFVCLTTTAQKIIINQKLLTTQVRQFEKTEFEINLSTAFINPFDEREIHLDMVLVSPSGKTLTLPCFYVSGDKQHSLWKGRFAPQEAGAYKYVFQLFKNGKNVSKSESKNFNAAASLKNGFLHINDLWTFKFDSGKPFRGLGENVGWESRSFENEKWSYEYLLSSLANNGANFFRTWMCQWNLPVAWKKVGDTNRYKDSDEYYNEGGIKRMDQLVSLCDSLGLHFMLSIDAHGAFIPGSGWTLNSHNKINGGPAATPEEFFTNTESKAMYKNRLRYLIARWGYSPSVAAWEFFNEIDNAIYGARDSVLISHKIITQWHDEMSTYLKKNDPYKHIVTTSVSHRDIEGMNSLPNIDLNQKHIYNHTNVIPKVIDEYVTRYKKPYVIGEFGYDWDWNNVKPEVGPQFDFDYKRGLWYGMFSPTPIIPMTWWWEFFDDRNMTVYLKGVSNVNNAMLQAGEGKFEKVNVTATGAEAFAVKCGTTYFVYLLNNSESATSSSITLNTTEANPATLNTKTYDPNNLEYKDLGAVKITDGKIVLTDIQLPKQREIVYIFSAAPVKASLGGQ